jgi:hypothetical protein
MPATHRSEASFATNPLVLSVKPFRLDVWLDAKGRIIRTESKQSVTSGTLAFTSTTIVTLSNFGEPVHIVAPTE